MEGESIERVRGDLEIMRKAMGFSDAESTESMRYAQWLALNTIAAGGMYLAMRIQPLIGVLGVLGPWLGATVILLPKWSHDRRSLLKALPIWLALCYAVLGILTPSLRISAFVFSNLIFLLGFYSVLLLKKERRSLVASDTLWLLGILSVLSIFLGVFNRLIVQRYPLYLSDYSFLPTEQARTTLSPPQVIGNWPLLQFHAAFVCLVSILFLITGVRIHMQCTTYLKGSGEDG